MLELAEIIYSFVASNRKGKCKRHGLEVRTGSKEVNKHSYTLQYAMYRIAKGTLWSQGMKGRPSEMGVNFVPIEGDGVTQDAAQF